MPELHVDAHIVRQHTEKPEHSAPERGAQWRSDSLASRKSRNTATRFELRSSSG